MQIKSFKFMLALGLITFFSCNTAKQNNTETGLDGHTSQNSLDWQGTYSGILPCADCEGIETELSLNAESEFVLISEYIDRFVIDTVKGTFTWEGNNIKLESQQDEMPLLYKVEENQLRQLHLDGKEVTGELAQHYVLRKNGNLNVEDKRWQLVELNGQKVKGNPDTHYLIFHSKEGRLEAKADCNVLLNDYKIKNELQLIIQPGISTLMACPDRLEDDYFKVLTLADNISTDGKTLTLNKGRMAPLARFELVVE